MNKVDMNPSSPSGHPKSPVVVWPWARTVLNCTRLARGKRSSGFSIQISRPKHVLNLARPCSTIDTATGEISDTRKMAHEWVLDCYGRLPSIWMDFGSVAINRVKRLTPNLISTGDDDGVVKVCFQYSASYPQTWTQDLIFFLFYKSYGTLENPRPFGVTPIILILFQTFYG